MSPLVKNLRLRLFLASASNGGVQFLQSVMFALSGPLLQSQFKLASSAVTVILAVVGPVSGFFIQPFVGAWSDRFHSRYGKRRPFILFGSISASLGILLVAFSAVLGDAFGDPGGDSSSEHSWGIALCLTGFVWFNLFINVVQGPARALVGDLAGSKQYVGQSLVQAMMMIAAVIAPIIGALLFYTDNGYQWLFMIAAIVVVLTAILTCVFGEEQSSLSYGGVQPISVASLHLQDSDLATIAEPQPEQEIERPPHFFQVFSTLRQTPKNLLRVLGAFFFSWCAFAPFLILNTLFFARNIYNGVAEGDASYQAGVRMSLFNSASFSGVSLLFALVLPFLIKRLGLKVVWTLTAVLSSVCYGLFLVVTSVAGAFFINIGVALNFTIFNSIPFALIPLYCASRSDVGLYVGLFNACALAAQALVNLIASGILELAGQDVAWAIALGLVFGFASAAFVLYLPNVDTERAAIMAAASVNPYVTSEDDDSQQYLFSASDSDYYTGEESAQSSMEYQQTSTPTRMRDFD